MAVKFIDDCHGNVVVRVLFVVFDFCGYGVVSSTDANKVKQQPIVFFCCCGCLFCFFLRYFFCLICKPSKTAFLNDSSILKLMRRPHAIRPQKTKMFVIKRYFDYFTTLRDAILSHSVAFVQVHSHWFPLGKHAFHKFPKVAFDRLSIFRLVADSLEYLVLSRYISLFTTCSPNIDAKTTITSSLSAFPLSSLDHAIPFYSSSCSFLM